MTLLNVGTVVCSLLAPPVVVFPPGRDGAAVAPDPGPIVLLGVPVGLMELLLFGNVGNNVLSFPLSCDPAVTILLLY